ncbi:hypothetical protein BDA96_03G034700 [Sorghum bicolor]|uniref:Uncharacterized protein n=1 Tax=Sorghum bicolor TaxID=4558 RepID=A0A921RAD0_SORBI|nr:hypothetical protein BDA96_03G034700 [Sorghum bicolor]
MFILFFSANDKQPTPSRSGGSAFRSLASMVTGVVPSTGKNLTIIDLSIGV